jgi:hypothetical protein
VLIETRFPDSGGIVGWFEQRMAPGMLRGLYTQELDLLEKLVTG